MDVQVILKNYLVKCEQQGLLRTRQLSEPTNSSLIHFDTNDYLSLAADKDIAKAYQYGYAHYPSGSGSSLLLSGYHPNHQALEQAFSQLLGTDDCLLFSSGYAANLAVGALLASIKASALVDRGVHASVYDGLNLAKVSYLRYQHNSLNHCSSQLSKVGANSVLITEGIFSMSGALAPLRSLHSLCVLNQVAVLVDEAHSFGVIGTHGQGAVSCQGLNQKEIPLRIIPLGKSCVAQGAVVVGQSDWIHALLQAGRSLIYSTAISPAICYGLLKTLDKVVAADDRRTHLQYLISLFKKEITQSPLQWIDSHSPIQQLQLGCPHKALYYAQELKKKGFSCFAIRAPTVPAKVSGLRIVLNYRHQEQQIKEFFNSLSMIYESTS